MINLAPLHSSRHCRHSLCLPPPRPPPTNHAGLCAVLGCTNSSPPSLVLRLMSSLTKVSSGQVWFMLNCISRYRSGKVSKHLRRVVFIVAPWKRWLISKKHPHPIILTSLSSGRSNMPGLNDRTEQKILGILFSNLHFVYFLKLFRCCIQMFLVRGALPLLNTKLSSFL